MTTKQSQVSSDWRVGKILLQNENITHELLRHLAKKGTCMTKEITNPFREQSDIALKQFPSSTSGYIGLICETAFEGVMKRCHGV